MRPTNRAPRTFGAGLHQNIAPHLAKEFPPGIAELVVGPVELSSIDKNHLQEPAGSKDQSETFLSFHQRANFEPPSKICLSEKIEIGLRNDAINLSGLTTCM